MIAERWLIRSEHPTRPPMYYSNGVWVYMPCLANHFFEEDAERRLLELDANPRHAAHSHTMEPA